MAAKADKKKTTEAVSDRSERQKALEMAMAQIEKQYGKGSIMRLGENTKMNVDAVPTGSIALDAALGIGGLPRGRIIEIYGPEASGKTTLALHAVAECQKMGGEAAFIDVEHALDPVYARALGVDVDSLLVSQPDTGEQALEIMEALGVECRPHQAGLFLWGRIPNNESCYDFCDRLLYEKQIFLTPGGIFGSEGNRYIRISLCAKREQLAEAIEAIEKNF